MFLTKRNWIYLILLLGIFLTVSDLLSSSASAAEENSAPATSLVSVNRLFFQPEAQISEPSQGGLGPLQWAVGLKSGFSQWIDIQAVLGASQLLYQPYWAPTNSESVALLEAIGTVHVFIGDIYAGQFLVPWGLEGSTEEENLFLPRSLLYEKGQFPLRDTGIGFKTDADGFYMNVAGHNGEGANQTTTDNRIFVTGEFGYKGAAHSNIGFSLTEGRVAQPFLTTEMKLRGANAFFGFNIFGLGLQLEGSYFQSFSSAGNSNILAWYGDLELPITSSINAVVRYEQFDPGLQTGSNVLGRGYLGGEWHSHDNLSRVFVFAIKNNESQQEVPNDGLLAMWRFTPPVDLF